MQLAQIKRAARPLIPATVINLQSQLQQSSRRQRFEKLRSSVNNAVDAIAALPMQRCLDADFLETDFIPSLGLNDENRHEQPNELSRYFGKGLHIWQYPNQLANYLVWLARNGKEITSYLEIGCRWGGMFILISEWLRKHSDGLTSLTAVDPIKPTPFIETYFALLKDRPAKSGTPIRTKYLCDFSTSQTVVNAVDSIRPDMVFIDGDHRLRGALTDHMMVRDHADIIVHHDVCSQTCTDTTFLWQALKKMERAEFVTFEFLDQYPSVSGNYLGIGAMKRRNAGGRDNPESTRS